jgi:uncharacterized membrane protein YesL
MRWLFNIENPVMRYILKIFDCMCLSLLWLACCLPILTAGAATTALYATVYRYLRKDEGHLLRTFLSAFRENWKRSTLVWLVILAVGILLGVDMLVFRTMALQGQFLGKLYWVILLLIGVWITWLVYAFAYCARFHGSVKDVLRGSALLMLLHPLRALTVFLPTAASMLVVCMAPGFVSIVPAVVGLICSITLEKIFKLHGRGETASQAKGDSL